MGHMTDGQGFQVVGRAGWPIEIGVGGAVPLHHVPSTVFLMQALNGRVTKMEPALNEAPSWCYECGTIPQHPGEPGHRIDETDGGPLSVPELRFSHGQDTPSIGSEPSDTEEVSTRRVQLRYIQYSTSRQRVAQTARSRPRRRQFQPFLLPFRLVIQLPKPGRVDQPCAGNRRPLLLGKGNSELGSATCLPLLASHRETSLCQRSEKS